MFNTKTILFYIYLTDALGIRINYSFENLQESLDACWKRDFERKYIELEELGRGRFSVVRKCQEILTGQEVAVKFINRRKQTRDETRKEYEILAMIGNERSCTVPSCLIKSSGLFLTATSDAIVMNL